MSIPDEAITRAGKILYRELPEEYRYRDKAPSSAELGDLEAYLHGFGHLLDLIRSTTEQAYADAFAEQTETGHSIQPWLLPYLADLVGAELVAPDPERRREELNHSILWSKSKGALRNVDQIADTLAGAETVVREGWRHTLTCPRPGLPPFSVPPVAQGDTTGHTPMPLGCPDFRAVDRAVRDPDGSNPLFRLRFPAQKPEVVYWKPRAAGAAPCFPGSYCDTSARCPDLRDMELNDSPGPNPARSLIHIRPPDGIFAQDMVEKTIDDSAQLALVDGLTLDPAYIFAQLGEQPGNAPDRLRLKLSQDLTIPAGMRVRFENICIVGTTGQGATRRPVQLRISRGARGILRGCAAEDVALPGNAMNDAPNQPVLDASDSIFGSISGPRRFARLVYCTVMGQIDLARLQASDCLLDTLSRSLSCEESLSCIRYSRFTPRQGRERCFVREAPTNTDHAPRFSRRYFKGNDGRCTLRLPSYGMPGYGVLDIPNHATIFAGAEDEGELGAHHAFHFAAQIRALHKKLSTYLPLGQEIELAYDPLLALMPPSVAASPD